MWTFLLKIILRYRVATLITITLLTSFMAYQASRVELSYDFVEMLPTSDPANQKYEEFKELFGQDGSVLYISVKNPDIFTLDAFNAWYDLTYTLKGLEGIDEVVSIANAYELYKDTAAHQFEFRPIIPGKPADQEELDSLVQRILSLPFYEGLLFNRDNPSTLMAVTLVDTLNFSEERNKKIFEIEEIVERFVSENDMEVHFSGMPYIRTFTQHIIQKELVLFVVLAMIIAGIALLVFFRSLKATIFPILIVLMGVIWVLGTIALFGYKITILTGILPPLTIIIGVENSIFLLNKYHHEYKSHRNKIKALSRVIQRVGNAIFLTNLTTAIGFSAFIITGNNILVEFGVIAAINIMVLFILTLFLIPIFFSFLPPPRTRHIKHLDNRFTVGIVNWLLKTVVNHRRIVYVVALTFMVFGIFGMTRLRTTGNYVDDIPKDEKIYQDLLFMEEEFQGMLPFEISIDTKKPRGVMRLSTIRKIDQLQDTLAQYPEFSRPLSVAEVVKFAHQSFYTSGSSSNYSLPSNRTMTFMMSWMPDFGSDKHGILKAYVDTSFQKTRVSARMKNISTIEIERISNELRPKIHKIFNPGIALHDELVSALDTLQDISWSDQHKYEEVLDTLFSRAADESLDTDSLIATTEGQLPRAVYDQLVSNSWLVPRTRDYDINITGIAVIYLKGSDYLVKNLRTSLLLAILAIGALMFLLFRSKLMVLISLIPNLLPQLLTAALMGILSIPIKPSTVIIFSIALGISVDNAIHFLSRYRLQLKITDWNIRDSVMAALKETSYGMIYSSIVLFLGFGIFVLSTFGGTKALGYLVSFTLLMAVASNLLLLPSLLLSLDKRITTRLFRDPMIVLLDEEEDIELDELEIEDEPDTRGGS